VAFRHHHCSQRLFSITYYNSRQFLSPCQRFEGPLVGSTKRRPRLEGIQGHLDFCTQGPSWPHGLASNTETAWVECIRTIMHLVVPNICALFPSPTCHGSDSIRWSLQVLFFGPLHHFIYPNTLHAHWFLKTWFAFAWEAINTSCSTTQWIHATGMERNIADLLS